MLCIEESQRAGVLVVRVLMSRVDAFATAELREAICATVRRGCREFVLDLGRVDFIDSTGLGMLAGLFKLVGLNGRILIAAATGPVQTVFRLTRMTNVFSMYETVDEAVRAMGPAPDGFAPR